MGDTDVRVVVTGMGAVTPIGLTLSEFRDGLFAGRSGVGPITQFDCDVKDPATGEPQFATRIAAEVKGFAPETFLRKPHRYDRAAQFALAAGRMAMDDAGLTIEEDRAGRIGVVVGTGMGDMRTVESAIALLQTKGARRLPPTGLPKVLPNSLAANIAIFLGARGPNIGISSACASSTHAVGEAYWMIRRGDADLMVAGGAEAAITPLTIGAFSAMRVMSRRNDDPPGASRPFDRDRDGFVMGEGAGLLILERLESARARGARIYAEVIGYGMTADAYNIADMRPDAAEPARAMRLALRRAGVAPEAVDYINAHGTATRTNDAVETLAIKEVLGPRARQVPVSATKSMVGHLLSGSGAVELIATILAIRDQRVHPTINLSAPDPECDLDYVPSVARSHPIQIALKNSFGFGGHNAALAFRRWAE